MKTLLAVLFLSALSLTACSKQVSQPALSQEPKHGYELAKTHGGTMTFRKMFGKSAALAMRTAQARPDIDDAARWEFRRAGFEYAPSSAIKPPPRARETFRRSRPGPKP